MMRQKNVFQTKEQDKTARKRLTNMEGNNLPDKEFKVIFIEMPTKLRRMDRYGEKFNKEIEGIKKEQIRTEENSN